MSASDGLNPRNEPAPRDRSGDAVDGGDSALGGEPLDRAGEPLEAMADWVGRSIAHFRIGERLGGGAMGSVYRAYDRKAEREVALKVLLPGADAVMRERFRREARTVSTLQHPNIIRTLEIGEAAANGVTYIAMELVEGASLGELLEKQGRLSPQDACGLLQPIADALAYAHEQGVIHRDVKPSNILLRRAAPNSEGSVRVGVLGYPVVPLLSDFGIARALDAPELTSAGRTIGTPAFMAPEQCAGLGEIDGRADMYSLGAVLYRCLVGKTPFFGSTTQILHAHVYDPVMIPEDVARALPAPVLALLMRSMMKEPGQRYATMGGMAEALGRCAALPVTDRERQDGSETDDSTMTMATLPVTPLIHSTAARILVPAAPTSPRPVGAVPLRPAPSATEVRPVHPAPARPQRGRLPSGGVGATAVGGALVVLLLILGATLFNNLLPDVWSRSRTTPDPGATPAQVAAGDAHAATTLTPVLGVSTGPTQTQDGQVVVVTPAPDDAPTATPAPAPPPAVPLDSAWSDAQAFFDEREWQSALDWLLIVRRIDEEFQAQRVVSMLVTVYVGLATEATVAGDLNVALTHLDNALRLDPDSALLREMTAATRALAEADVGERAEPRRVLQGIHVDYAASLLENEPCAAVDQLAAALRILSDPVLLERRAEYEQACSDVQVAQELSELGGSIIYSSQQDGVYRIFRMTVGEESPATLLVNNATQPSLAPNGRMLAFYSTRPDAQGLYGFDLMAGLGVDGRSLRFTNAPEDARDAPARWNSQGNRLAFTSTRFGDGRYRVYLTWADSGEAVDSPGYGKDPVWNPFMDSLVINGPDESGGSPGLWLMAADGGSRVRLTDNGNDQRPTWTPDGAHVVFMSNGRDGNWELYRIDVTTRSIVRLTDHPAQDGLPTVSPDGQTVAFMSDRDGYWRIWYVSIDGGEAHPLGSISGELPKWLEHAIQWVR